MKRIPQRAKGAVLINPRPKRSSTRSARLKALFGGVAKRRKRNPSRRRRAARKPLGELIVNPRRRRRVARKATRRVRRRNPSRRVARKARRKHPVRRRRAAVRRRNPRRRIRRSIARGSIVRTRKNPRRRSSVRRRNPMRRKYARRRNGLKSSASGLFASLMALAPQSVFGALSVEPTLAVAQIAARYWPGLSTTWLYPLSGLVTATALKLLLPKLGVSRALADQLAIATASAGGAVGYYKFRTGQSGDSATEMAGLVLSGHGSPVAGLVLGDSGLGELVAMSGYGGYSGASYGNAAYATHMNGAAATGMAY